MTLDLVLTILAGVIPIIFAVSLHEVAHGRVAYHLGDPTAHDLGRLTVNPLKHIDPVGTVLVPIAMFLLTKALLGQGIPFGWAKPVPVDTRNFSKPRKHMALVAIAGPLSNLLMALLWYGVLLWLKSIDAILFFILMAQIGVIVNLVLMFLNLLPIPPLDGGRVVVGLLPTNMARLYGRIEVFGMMIVIFLLISGILGKILSPLYLAVLKYLKL